MAAGHDDEVGRLFADITAHLEDAHEFATVGQNPHRPQTERATQAEEVRSFVTAIDIALTTIEEMIGDASG